MELNLYTQSLLWAFGLSLVFGAIANKANFCTMGAVPWARYPTGSTWGI
jgi:hypothetical protein